MSVSAKIVYTLIVIVLAATSTSCSTISYYRQSVAGQLALSRAQMDFKTILQATDTPVELKQRLLTVSRIRDFASDVLKLPNNNSYRSYADIGRQYIVWNVFATPALSLKPHQSCFLIIGCLSYRGYFNKADAVTYMNNLKRDGYDVYLGGVSAYSTLGWFDDPIVNGMLARSDIELARLIFHELAHQQLYIKDDTEFNEAFADAVALIGLEYWLETNASNEQRNEFEYELEREEQFTKLVLSYQEKLVGLFRSDINDTQKFSQKKTIYRELQQDYASLRAAWGNYGKYDNWFSEDLNNAKLAAVSTYRNLVPLFFAAYRASAKDMTEFYSHIEKISQCSPDRRRQLLRSRSAVDSC